MRSLRLYIVNICLVTALLVGSVGAQAPVPTFNALDTNVLDCASRVYNERVSVHTRNQRLLTGAITTAAAAGLLYFFYPVEVVSGIGAAKTAAIWPVKICARTLTPQFIKNYLHTSAPKLATQAIKSTAIVSADEIAKEVVNELVDKTVENAAKVVTSANLDTYFDACLKKRSSGFIWGTAKTVMTGMVVNLGLSRMYQLLTVYKPYDTEWALGEMSVMHVARRVKQHAAAVDPDDTVLTNGGTLQIQLYGDDAIAQINGQPSDLAIINDLLALSVYVKAQRKADGTVETAREFADLALAWNQFVVRVGFVLAAMERDQAELSAECSLEKNDLTRYRESVISTINDCSAALNTRAASVSYDNVLSTVYLAVTKAVSALNEARFVVLY